MRRFFVTFAIGALVILSLGFAVSSAATPTLTPLDARVKTLETTQAALLKRVAVLETVVAGQPKTAAAMTPSAPAAKGAKIDELGLGYEFIPVDSSIVVAGWEVYANRDGAWSVAGNVQNKSTTDRFSVVDFKIKFYKGQRLIQVAGFSVGGRWVDPGQSLPFEFSANVKPDEVERYTVEASAGDWRKVP